MQGFLGTAQIGLGDDELVSILIKAVLVYQLRSRQFLTTLVLLLAQCNDCALPIDIDAILANARLFTGDDGVVGTELWRSDGTTDGTYLVKDIAPGSSTAFFLPTTFIVGLYGMNFEHMPELKHPAGYPAVIGLMIVVTLVIYSWFKRKGWI